ncbi:uncharacterized protein LOC136091967 [Hydra vulgaris]|uniref:Uncharacterized protein LOC136091967 n=1 Tax=Hydra vulgaris TaxID=6087 RepID=A0ABM4DMG4_HYDVU
MFKEFKKETDDMIKQQEKNVLNISSNANILFERSDRVETHISENKRHISQDKCKSISITRNNESAFTKITNKIREIEDRSRRNNLRIDGIKESEGLKDIKIEKANRTVHKDSVRPKTVIIKLLNFKDKVDILKKTPNLKGKNIYINEDFYAKTVQIRKVFRASTENFRSNEQC